jgi:hypothetical protein
VDIRLLRTGLDDLSPGYYRSPGIHVSTLLSRLCIRFGHFEKKKEKDGTFSHISDRNREMGNAFEHSVVERAARKWPGRYIHNPEIRCDGLYITPDLISAQDGVSWSLKCTWMSPARGPEDVKMWKYLEQLKEELYCLRRVCMGSAGIREARVVVSEADVCDIENSWTTNTPPYELLGDSYLTGLLTVCFVNDFRPEKEQIPTWEISFFPEELEMTHAMIMGEKVRFLDEGGCEWCGEHPDTGRGCCCCRECGGVVYEHKEGCANG